MKAKKYLYYILAAVALLAIILTLVLLSRQGQEPVPEETAVPVIGTTAPDTEAATPVPATVTPEPTEIPPAITPPADQAASGTDIILRPVTPATDGDVYYPSPAETTGG